MYVPVLQSQHQILDT